MSGVLNTGTIHETESSSDPIVSQSFSYRLHPKTDAAVIMSTASKLDLMTIPHPTQGDSSIQQRRLFAYRNGAALVERLGRTPPADWARMDERQPVAIFLSPVVMTTERDYTEFPSINGIVRSIIALALEHWTIGLPADPYDVECFTRRYAGISVNTITHETALGSWLPGHVRGAEQISLHDLGHQYPVVDAHIRSWLAPMGYDLERSERSR